MEESGGGGAPWINTFADLMNLLLCFFVMLFALSDVNGEKYEKISISMANSFGVFAGGGASAGNGQLIGSGMTQMTELGDYLTQMGATNDASKTGNVEEGEDDISGDTENDNEGTGGSSNNQGTGGSEATDNTEDVGLDEAMEKIDEERENASSGMYDEISDLTDKYNLGDYVDLNIDSDYKYVQLTLRGSVLYDSGEADIKEVAKPILTKIGDILKKFKGYHIEITGHTDNVPMNDSTYKDNNWLSTARALNAAEYLINECSIDPAVLKYSGRGEYEPISSNATPEGRAKNRRIEIKIYNEYSGY
jgi:chemotaxis protein MotB